MPDATKKNMPTSRWAVVVLTSVLPLITAAIATFFFTFRSTLPDSDTSKVTLLFWGFAFLFATVVLQALKIILEQRQKNAANKATAAAIEDADQARAALTLAMKDVLQQLAEKISQMPYIADAAKRDTHLHLVAKYAVDAIRALISPAAGDVRANVFGLTPTRDGLVCVESSRKKKPNPFQAGEADTREALEFLGSGERIMLYPDLSKKQPTAGSRRNQTGYRSFLSVPIAAPDPDSSEGELKVYGMVSIDSAAADVFTANDEHVAELVADLIATAFAIDDATTQNERVLP